MKHEIVNPVALGAPRGYSNGVLAAPGRLLFVAGQIAWDEAQHIVSDDLAVQFGRALENVLTVVQAAGGSGQDIVRMTIYVTSRNDYLQKLRLIGHEYRRVLGKHYPAMVLAEVAALLEPQARVEIEAMAVIPV